MIDAPDHTADERDDRSARVWLFAALLGMALSAVAGVMSYGYTTAQAEQRFADAVNYVATQSLSLRCVQQRLCDQKPDSRYGDCRRGGAQYGARRLGG